MRIVCLVVVVAACGPARHGAGDDDGSGIDAPGSTGDGATDGVSLVYAHSGSALYRVDAMTLTTVEIGPLTGIGTDSLTDLAIDKNEDMVGITLDKLYSIDASSGGATLIKDLSQSATGFTSLSYIPTDLTDPNSADILVSANDEGAVYKIDPRPGTPRRSAATACPGATRSCRAAI